MTPDIEKKLTELGRALGSDESIVKSVMSRIEGEKIELPQPTHNVWRMIMKSRITKFAAAAVVMIGVVGLFIDLFHNGASPAYAIEQTIMANQNLNFVHFYFVPHNNNLKKEAWIQYDENGNLKKLRVDMYNTGGAGTKWIEVWSEGTTVIWSVNENIADYYDCNSLANKQMLTFVQHFAPREAIDFLYKMKQEGKAQIIAEQDSNNEIRIRGQYPKGAYLTANPDFPPSSDILVINPNSKLVTKIEVYKDEKFVGAWEKYDYQSFEPNVFDIEQRFPDDVVKMVEYDYSDVNSVGMAKGNFTDEEIGPMIVQAFLNALIAKDYNEVGKLFGGMPVDEAQQQFEDFNIVRVISIGNEVEKTEKSPAYYPCSVEIKENGKATEWQPRVFVGRVFNSQGNRWRIEAVK